MASATSGARSTRIGRPPRGWVRKNLNIDQRKLDAARKFLGVTTETEAPVLMPPPSVIFSVPHAGGLPGSARSQTAKTRSRRRTWDASTRRGCCGLH